MTHTPSAPYSLRRERLYRTRGSSDFKKPTLAGVILRYFLLALLFIIAVAPFIWQLSTAFKGPTEDIYTFPPNLIPAEPTLENFSKVTQIVPVFRYAFHSFLIACATVFTQVLFSLLAGYALGCLRFRGKAIAVAILFSVLLLPGEVTLTSQYQTIKSLGLENTLVGVFLPGAIGAINVLLMATACRGVPAEVLDAATVDGANTWQRITKIVWPNVRGMASVVAVFSFIGAWDDFLWPLVVLNDTDKYTLTVGMQYLNSTFSSNPRLIAAGTIIALIPIIVFFASMQKFFFKGVEVGGVKG